MTESGEPMTIIKRGIKIPMPSPSPFDGLSDIFSIHTKAHMLGMTRAVASRKMTYPTPEELAEYARLRAMLDEIEASPFWGRGFDGGYLREPAPHEEIEYAETWDEFAARVKAADLPTRLKFPLSSAFAKVALSRPDLGIVFPHPAV